MKGAVLQSSNFKLQSFPQLPQANWSLLQMPTNTLYVPTSQPSQARIQAPPWGEGASLPPCFFQQTLVSLRAGVVHHSFCTWDSFWQNRLRKRVVTPQHLFNYEVRM